VEKSFPSRKKIDEKRRKTKKPRSESHGRGGKAALKAKRPEVRQTNSLVDELSKNVAPSETQRNLCIGVQFEIAQKAFGQIGEK